MQHPNYGRLNDLGPREEVGVNYDAIIVGARCAGSPVAMLLARLGYRVLLLDKATFPSDIMSTHFIHLPGVANLKRWGLLDQVLATNCPKIGGFRIDIGVAWVEGTPPDHQGITFGLCPRRIALDKILGDAAIKAGAELRESFYFLGVTEENGRVTGIRGRDAHGAEVVEKARIVIGADGQHSAVARAVGAGEYREVEARGCAYYSYFRDVPMRSTEIYRREGGEILAFPTNDGKACIAVYRPHAEFAKYRADVEGIFFGDLREYAPSLAERAPATSRDERWIGTADTRNFFRKAYGPGWALVGDAGYHKDPLTGYGIMDAFRDAELLAAAIHAGFTGVYLIDDALSKYEQTRDRVAGPLYEATLQATLLLSPEPMAPIFKAVNRSQELKKAFFGNFTGAAFTSELLTPEFLDRTSRN